MTLCEIFVGAPMDSQMEKGQSPENKPKGLSWIDTEVKETSNRVKLMKNKVDYSP